MFLSSVRFSAHNTHITQHIANKHVFHNTQIEFQDVTLCLTKTFFLWASFRYSWALVRTTIMIIIFTHHVRDSIS